jgi:RimJ/RimL family protein N-acetyltransferase
MVELVRLSGYRLRDLPPDKYAWRMAALRSEIQQKYLPLFSQLDFGFYLDDADKNIAPLDLLMGKVQNGEVYIVSNENEFIGIAAITPIQFGRNGYIEAIATQKYRGSLAVGRATGELLVYAFKEYGDAGLGLKKLIARVAALNISTVQMLAKAGFKPCGVLRGEMLHGGLPSDMILLELLNPLFFEVKTDVISTISTGVQPDQLRESPTPESSAVSGECPPDPERNPIGWPGESDDGGGSELAEPEQLQRDIEPISAGRTGRSVRPESDESIPELVSAESGESTSGADVSPEPKSRRRVRV